MTLTREDKENEPVHDQDGPEDGHVKDGEPSADERDANGPRGPVPELELGKTPDEGLELLVLLGRQSADGAILHLVIERIVGGVELGLEESQEQVQEVDAERVGNCADEKTKESASDLALQPHF